MKKQISRAITTVLSLFIICNIPGLFTLTHAKEVTGTDQPLITVLSPMGQPPAIQMLAMAPRLDTLDGKTIYIVDDGYVGGDVLLKEMVAWFERNRPEVKAIYKRKAGGFTDEDPALWAEIKEKGDAMIMGMGH